MRGARPSGTATVLFTDLVGSTDLLSRLGEPAFDEVRRAHFATLREALARHDGEEVKTLGDGVLAVFGSASDAVSCAVGIQQVVDRQSRREPAPLSVRVGMALGDVSFEEEDVFGTPVVEAARLVAAAGPGQILATAAVRWAGGSRSGASFSDRGPLELKGLPEPVPTCEVLWERSTAPSIPLPTLLTDLGRIFVGREAEVERLSQLWKEAVAGERRVALLAGEPGVGKTRLAAELAARVHDEGSTVLAGRCDEDMGVPYQPFVEALRHFIDHTAPEQLRERIGRYGGELARLVPELIDQVPGLPPPLESDPETERYRLFDAIAAWLTAASREQPLLLVLDDLQWAAKPTLLLLRHVLRASEATRLLVVVTYRDTDIGRGHPFSEFVADLRRDVAVARYSLAGLDRAAVGAYIEAAAGHALPEEDEDFARAVWEETEGNPFFVAEVLRHLAESGAIEQRDGRWTTTAPVEELGIPEGVRDVVGRRLARLAGDTDRVLGVASVVGLEFEPTVVGAGGGFGEDQLFSALEEAAAARLLTEVSGGRFRFAHALVRATLYDELSGPRRTALHRRVAVAIESLHVGALDDHLPALAHHWARAAAPTAETARAIDYAARAGDRALRQLAHDEAATYYRSALELLEAPGGPPDEARRLELLLALGEAQRRAGEPAHRETLLAAARLAQDRGDSAALARAALANTRAMLMANVGTVDAERTEALEAALVAVGAADTAIRARLLATIALETVFAGQGDRHFRLSDEALATARRIGDLATLAGVLLARHYTIYTPATLPERLANTAEAVAIAEGLSDPVARCRAAFVRSRCLLEAGEIEEAERQFAAAEALASELGQATLLWTAGWNRAAWLLRSGRIDEADAVAETTLELGRTTGQADGGLFYAVQMAHVRRDQGRLGEHEEALRQAASQWPTISSLRSYLAEAYCELGRDADASAILDSFAAARFAVLPFDLVWMSSITSCTSVAAHLRDTAAAGVLRELLSPYANQVVVTASVICGAATHHLGVLATTLGRFDEAAARFASAEATHDRIEAPSWLARTRLEWARMLLTRRQPGDIERARKLVGQALTTARELSLTNVERRAVALLQECP